MASKRALSGQSQSNSKACTLSRRCDVPAVLQRQAETDPRLHPPALGRRQAEQGGGITAGVSEVQELPRLEHDIPAAEHIQIIPLGQTVGCAGYNAPAGFEVEYLILDVVAAVADPDGRLRVVPDFKPHPVLIRQRRSGFDLYADGQARPGTQHRSFPRPVGGEPHIASGGPSGRRQRTPPALRQRGLVYSWLHSPPD